MLSYNEKRDLFYEKHKKVLECKNCGGTGLLPNKSQEELEELLERVCRRVKWNLTLKELYHYTSDEYIDKINNTQKCEGSLQGSFMPIASEIAIISARKNIFCECKKKREIILDKMVKISMYDRKLYEFFSAEIINQAKDVKVGNFMTKIVNTEEDICAYYMCNAENNIKIMYVDQLLNTELDISKLFGIMILGIDTLTRNLYDNKRMMLLLNIKKMYMRRIPMIALLDDDRVLEELGLSRYFNYHSKKKEYSESVL
ncbi:MAG: hypothetical protein ACRC31_00975 [Cetobacterium sp.]